MGLPTPLVTFLVLVLALLLQSVVCAPATVVGFASIEAEDIELQQQLGQSREEERGSGRAIILPSQEEEQSALDAVFPAFSSIDNNRPSEEEEEDEEEAFTTPSRYHSTLLARRLLALSSTGVLTTVFPRNISEIPAYGRTPPEVAGISIGLPEYIADCEGEGNPTVIMLGVSTSTKNVEFGSDDGKGRNVSLSISWWEQYAKPQNKGREAWSMADLPRVSLLGYLEEIPGEEVEEMGVEECFVRRHRDSRLWLPGSKFAAHQGKWARVVVQQVYWIGGFGGTNYIGWLDGGEWRGVGEEEWKGVRLRGERG